MAVWLAEQVGPKAHVVATDLNTTYLQRIELPNLEVLEHNILDDSLEALRPGSFDLVCSRLDAVPPRERAGARHQANGGMPPPGWLADRRGRRLGDVRSRRPRAPPLRRLPAGLAVWRLVDRPRVRQGVRAQAAGPLRPLRPQDIRHEAATEAVRGGSDWARWWAVTLEVMNEQGGGDESDRRDVQVMATALADPTVWFLRELLHACCGRRPA